MPTDSINQKYSHSIIYYVSQLLTTPSGSGANTTRSCEIKTGNFLWLIWDHYINKKVGCNAIWTVISCCWQHCANSVKIIKPFSIHFSGAINLIVGGLNGGYKSDDPCVTINQNHSQYIFQAQST